MKYKVGNRVAGYEIVSCNHNEQYPFYELDSIPDDRPDRKSPWVSEVDLESLPKKSENFNSFYDRTK